MIEKYNNGIIPTISKKTAFHDDLVSTVEQMPELVDKAMNQMQFSIALEEIWKVIRRANKYVDETMPWKLAKDESAKEELNCVLYDLAETLRIVTIMISPILHHTDYEIGRASCRERV